jgi:hypothetical protein
VHNEELHNLNASPNVITVIRVKEDGMGEVWITHAER